MASTANNHYYVPHGAYWPLVGSIALATTTCGLAIHLNYHSIGLPIMYTGIGILIVMMFGWFGTVVKESEGGVYGRWEDKSFRLGMAWFIFSEVMFFGAFFGALYYARILSVPWLLGDGAGVNTHQWLWSTYTEVWPTNGPLDMGESDFHMGWWPLPFINTVILLSSGVTVTIAHHAIDALVDRGRAATLRFLGALNDTLEKSAFVAGGAFSIADITAFCVVDFAKWIQVRAGDEHPHLNRWYADVKARPSSQA